MDFEPIKQASRELMLLTDEQRNDVLRRIADCAEAATAQLLAANAIDLQKLEPSDPLYDRLLLTPERIAGIAADLCNVARLPSPLGIASKERILANGLYLRRISVPFGVIGIIFEARPNVCFDVFSLCFKSGNACILKGSRSAEESNRAIVSLIHDVLREAGICPDVVTLMPPTHEATAELLGAVGSVDLVIPRGGRKLIDFVRDNARVPVIETGAGVVHAYFDKDGDLEKGRRIICNAKMRRVSVCNALDCLLVHRDRAADIPALLAPMEGRVEIVTDEAAMGTEWMDYKLSLRVVDSLDEALAHIARYGSGHSECIITENGQTASRFQQMVDAACVYVNAPTSFTDGAQFGLGAEIGISTQKLGPRGPMALEEMTTYKWLINGNGQVRS
ncbi:MAG: glutamate-5-semialdehyde dehydrogenase [Bacteroidaceae bacterium]|jgi:glutamate-5-semialdehyde dehydrogenase|nr:glutamate-5-semialdehyde dehydrogenase [Bacteroidaceae bacterium]